MERDDIYEILNDAYFGPEAHEQDVIRSLRDLLPSRGTFVDLGASLGQYSKAVAEIFESGKIIAVEADPIRFEQLQRNFDSWRKEHPAVEFRAVHAAVSDEPGSITFQSTNSNVSGGLARNELAHLSEDARKAVEWEEVEVPALTLDGLLENETVDLVKMDIEGAEWRAFAGAQQLLREGRSLVLVELHPFGGPDGGSTRKIVLEQMKAHGFQYAPLFDKALFGRGLWHRQPRLFFRSRLARQLERVRAKLRAGV